MVILRSGGNTDALTNNPNITTSSTTINQEMADMIETVPSEQPETEVTNAQLQETLNNLLSLVQTNNDTMSNDIHTIKDDMSQIKDVTNETDAIKQQLYSTQGKVARLERKNQHLEEKLISYETKMMEKDLMFYNVRDNQDETYVDLKDKIFKVLRDDMKIPSIEIYSKNNMGGEIRPDTITRIGKFSLGKRRPVVVSFVTKSGRNLVYSRLYTSNLKQPIKVRVSENYPAITREKRKAQIETLKSIKNTFKNTSTRVVMSKDKILVNGKPKNCEAFARNTLPESSPFSISYEKLEHSEIITDNSSIFQAHILPVHTKDQASAARNAIYQNPELATATHVIYAYKLGSIASGDSVESGFSDDLEIEGGSLLMSLIEIENRTDVFICVTRIKNGPNIGPSRFTHIKTCAQEMLQNGSTYEPTFNHITFN